ncbi:MAG: CrcB family protein, partial [Actinomyces sp.]|nr:CrcB family protein [Actinomyces sp.]
RRAARRFLVDSWVTGRSTSSVPLGTVVVNVSACFCIGLLTGAASVVPALAALSPVLGTGFLGGYSTFSTASVEGARLVRTGRLLAGCAHAGGMIILSLCAGLLGLALFRL